MKMKISSPKTLIVILTAACSILSFQRDIYPAIHNTPSGTAHITAAAAGKRNSDKNSNQFFEITSSCLKKTATIGEPVDCSVTITGAGSGGLKIDEPEQNIYPEKKENPVSEKKIKPEDEAEDKNIVPLFNISSFDKKNSENGITLSFSISAYRPGKHSIPVISIKGDDGIPIGYASPEIEISELNPDAKLEDIEPPLDLRGNYYRLAGIIIAAVIAGALAFFLIRKYLPLLKKNKPEEPSLTAIEIFRMDIAALNPGSLIDEMRIEDYSSGVSAVFRKYLSARFKFDANEMTSDEINYKMKKVLRGHTGTSAADIAGLLELWDLAKFAEFSPSAETLKLNLDLLLRTAERLSTEESDVRA